MMQVKKLSREAYEEKLAALGVAIPVEQLPVWLEFESTIPGRSPSGYAVIEDEGITIAAICFAQYETHGYRYLRAHHGPIWVEGPRPRQRQLRLKPCVRLFMLRIVARCFAVLR